MNVRHVPWQSTLRVSPRRELRLALLAAMETCWVYAVLAFLAALQNATRLVSPLSLFFAYWIALAVGRMLPAVYSQTQSRQVRRDDQSPANLSGARPPAGVRWAWLQLAAIGTALVTLLAIVRIDLFRPQAGWLDFAWLNSYVGSLLAFRSALSSEVLTTVGVVYVFVRGLGLGQRPLTHWFMGLQFRIGIVAFFLLFLVAGFIKPFDASPWVFAYFFVSLLSVALARMEEVGSDLRVGPRRAGMLFSAAGLVLLLGFILRQVFQVDVLHPLMWLLGPVGTVVGAVLYVILYAAGVLAEWLIGILRPLFPGVGQMLDGLKNLFPPPEEAQRQVQSNPALDWLWPLLQALVIAAILLAVGYLIARALSHRLRLAEEAEYIRESIGVEDRMGESARGKKPARRRNRGSAAAESIRRIYAAMIARAAEADLPRRSAETPYEFLPRLENTWPEETKELHAITEAYVAVHYAEKELDAEQVGRVQSLWRQVEGRIRRGK